MGLNSSFSIAAGLMAGMLASGGVAKAGMVSTLLFTLPSNPGADFGYSFSLSEGTGVTALGMFSADTLGPQDDVALRDSSGNLLDSILVPADHADSSVGAGSGGYWYFESLASPLSLGPGTYTLGAEYPGGSFAGPMDTATVEAPSPSLIAFTAGLASPAGITIFQENGISAPNLEFTPVRATPEPITWETLALAGGILLVCGRRRRSRPGRAA